MASSQATVVPAFRLPSSRGESFGDYCRKTRNGTSLSFWCKVYHALVLLCCKFERDRLWQRGASRQKLLEASGRVVAILTTVASRGCPQWRGPCNDCYQTAGLMTRQINKGRDGKHSAALKRLHFAVNKNKSFMNILNNRGPKIDTRGASLRGLPMNFWCGLSFSCVVSVGTDGLPETHGQA